MRVAHVITRMILGGAQENTLHNCVDLLRDFGDDVRLITGPSEGPEGDLLPEVEAEQVPLEVCADLIRPVSPWSDVQAYGQIARALSAFQPDIVHTHSAKAGVLGRLAAWRLGIPVVHTVHGAPFYPYQPWIAYHAIRWAEWLAARWTDRLICVAEAMTQRLVDGGVAQARDCTTIYSGFAVESFLRGDAHRAARRRMYGFTDQDVVIAKVARLAPLKGHDDLLAAFARLHPRCPETRLLLVGDGELRKSLEEQVAAADLTSAVRFAGLVPREAIPACLAACDFVVHASLREGLARVLPQALAAGKPCVSYDIDGAREVVVDDRTGYLVPAQDVLALADRMERLTADESLRRQLGENRRQAIAEQFDHRRMTARIREVYEAVLGGDQSDSS